MFYFRHLIPCSLSLGFHLLIPSTWFVLWALFPVLPNPLLIFFSDRPRLVIPVFAVAGARQTLACCWSCLIMSVKKSTTSPYFQEWLSQWSEECQMTRVISVTDKSCSQFDDFLVKLFGITSLYTIATCAERNDNYSLKHCVSVWIRMREIRQREYGKGGTVWLCDGCVRWCVALCIHMESALSERGTT